MFFFIFRPCASLVDMQLPSACPGNLYLDMAASSEDPDATCMKVKLSKEMKDLSKYVFLYIYISL